MGKKWLILIAAVLILTGFSVALPNQSIAGRLISISVNNEPLQLPVSPSWQQDRIVAPVRAIAEGLGASVVWDGETETVYISDNRGAQFLKGANHLNDPAEGISRNMISAKDLKNLLDDDLDGDLADYRPGYSGGDLINNDPLVIDVRSQRDFESAHIPGAVWIAPAADMGNRENIVKLKEMLEEHTAKGGSNEIVVYCYTGNTSGLLAGVLGTAGLPVKNMKYGFDIAWQGTKTADAPIKAIMEDSDGKSIECGG